MDIRFLAKLREAGPTQYEQGYNFCNRLAELCDLVTGRPDHPMRVEEVITALGSVFVAMCADGGYDAVSVSEMVIEAYDRKEKQRLRRLQGPPDTVDA